MSGSAQKVPIKFSDQVPTPNKEEPEAEMRVVTASALRALDEIYKMVEMLAAPWVAHLEEYSIRSYQ